MKEVIIYTDGACSGNPGPGGWGAILSHEGKTLEISGYEKKTTNNRMELTAAIKALKRLRAKCKISLHSDSSYLINSFNMNWLDNWKKKPKKWENLPNKDLWIELDELNRQHIIFWVKVKGHSDNAHNNRCDELARNAIKDSVF